ncbi:MAG TPA: WG repeat-containing protein [Syntrophales bacterium]|nr:WG repeat-containing protein [Syntrophales bacterium]
MRNLRSSAAIAVIMILACAGLAAGAVADSGIVDQNGCKHTGAPKPGITVTWSGGCVNGSAEGSGTQVWFKNGVETSRYVGPMRAGARHGKGIYTWKSGDRYEGDFADNKRTGKGVYTWPSGSRHEGDFVDGKRTGMGVYVTKAGLRKEGEFLDGAYVPDLDIKFHRSVSGKAMTKKSYRKDSVKYGMVNNKLEFLAPPVFKDLSPYIEDRARALFKEKWGFLDVKGDYAVPPSFDYAGHFSEGLASVCVGDRWGYIDRQGNWIIRPEFEYGAGFSEGMAVVRKGRKFGFIKKDGTYAVEPRFQDATAFSEGMAAVKMGGKWGFIDPSGKMIIKPDLVSKPGRFKAGVAIVPVRRGKNVIDKTGKIIIDSQRDKNWECTVRQITNEEFSADGLARFIQYKDPATGRKYNNSELIYGCFTPKGDVVDCGGDNRGRTSFSGFLPLKVIKEGRKYFLADETGKKTLDLSSLEQKIPWAAGVRTIPEFEYLGGGVVHYYEARKDKNAVFVDGKWIAPAPSLKHRMSPLSFVEKCRHAVVFKTEEDGRCTIYKSDGKWARVPVEELVPNLAERLKYYESFESAKAAPASPGAAKDPQAAASADRPGSWDWKYAYGRPGDKGAGQYIVKTENAEVFFEDPVYYWKPGTGGVKQGAKPGVIVYRFRWDKTAAAARLFINLPTFHWAYSRGHNKLYGSRDGAAWVELMDVPPPAFGKASSGVFDRNLPDRLLGGKELWLKVELDAFGPGVGRGRVFANTAQANRFQKGSNAETFRLEVRFAPKTDAQPPAAAAPQERKVPAPKGRVLD